MKTAFVADTGVFVRCGGPGAPKYDRLRRAATRANATLRIPRRVYTELGGDPDPAYPSSSIPWQSGIDDGWIAVAAKLDYANPIVSGIMDAARRFIANETDRPEDYIEKADTALVGLAAQYLDDDVDTVVLLTTDKPAGRAAETLLPEYGFTGRIEYRYASEAYLETVTANEFSVQ